MKLNVFSVELNEHECFYAVPDLPFNFPSNFSPNSPPKSTKMPRILPIKSFHNTYKRLCWDVPCHARTTKSGEISSHNNVHPGRLKPDGTYSDARVLSMLELLIVASLPLDWNIPEWASDRFIRHAIGESVPPLLMKNVFKTLEEFAP